MASWMPGPTVGEGLLAVSCSKPVKVVPSEKGVTKNDAKTDGFSASQRPEIHKEAPGWLRRAREAPESLGGRSKESTGSQVAPGGPRRPKEASEAPRGPRRDKEVPRASGRPQETPRKVKRLQEVRRIGLRRP